jgi:hypothetical protein
MSGTPAETHGRDVAAEDDRDRGTMARWQEVINHDDADEHPAQRQDDGEVPIEELARRQGIKPIKSVDELAQPDFWESDEEYEAFLADLYASRGAGLA